MPKQAPGQAFRQGCLQRPGLAGVPRAGAAKGEMPVVLPSGRARQGWHLLGIWC